MATEIYGASDDLVEVDGDVRGEVGSFGTDDDDQGVLLMCSDGTVLEAKYGKDDKALWGVRLIEKGILFGRIDLCVDEDAKRHSDTARFKDGLKWVYAAKGGWERVR